MRRGNTARKYRERIPEEYRAADRYRAEWEGVPCTTAGAAAQAAAEEEGSEPEQTADWELIAAAVPPGPPNTYQHRPFAGGPYYVICSPGLGPVSVVVGPEALKEAFTAAGLDPESTRQEELKEWIFHGGNKYKKEQQLPSAAGVIRYQTLEAALNYANLLRATREGREGNLTRATLTASGARRTSMTIYFLRPNPTDI